VTEPLRVVLLDHTGRLSGAEIATANLVASTDGCEVHALLAEDGPLAGRLRAAGATVEVVPLAAAVRKVRRDRVGLASAARHTRVLAGYAVELADRIRALDADVVHTVSLKAAVYGGLAGRLAGVPVVWAIHDRIAPDYLPAAAVWAVRAAAATVPSAIVANSETTRRTLGRFARRPVVVPPAIPPAAAAAPEPAGGRQFTVGVVGRLSPW
jgi:hypothetical protein